VVSGIILFVRTKNKMSNLFTDTPLGEKEKKTRWTV
jgi:hypothetical protein